jgi:hypothetical protein
MAKNIPSQIANLEAKLQELRAAQVLELKEKLRKARSVVADLENEIERLSGRPPQDKKRKRTSSAEVRKKIYAALQKAKEGLSQKEISEQSGVNYATVALFLRKNQKEFRTTGEFKSKRYFLKA